MRKNYLFLIAFTITFFWTSFAKDNNKLLIRTPILPATYNVRAHLVPKTDKGCLVALGRYYANLAPQSQVCRSHQDYLTCVVSEENGGSPVGDWMQNSCQDEARCEQSGKIIKCQLAEEGEEAGEPSD